MRSVLEEGLRSAHGLNPGVSSARRVGRVRKGLMEDGTLKDKGRIPEGEEGEGSPSPNQLLCSKLSCDLRRLY